MSNARRQLVIPASRTFKHIGRDCPLLGTKAGIHHVMFGSPLRAYGDDVRSLIFTHVDFVFEADENFSRALHAASHAQLPRNAAEIMDGKMQKPIVRKYI